MTPAKQAARLQLQAKAKTAQRTRALGVATVATDPSGRDPGELSGKGKGKQPVYSPPHDQPKGPMSLNEYARKQQVSDKPSRVVKPPPKAKPAPKPRALTSSSRGPRDLSVIKAKLYITLLETMQKLMKVTRDDIDSFSGAMEALDTPIRSLRAVKVTRETGTGTLISVGSADDTLDYQEERFDDGSVKSSSVDEDDALGDLERLVDFAEGRDTARSGEDVDREPGGASGGRLIEGKMPAALEAFESEESEEE